MQEQLTHGHCDTINHVRDKKRPHECQVFVKLYRCCGNSYSQIGVNDDLNPMVCIEILSGT